MLFSSMIFLWLFLPCVLILNLILPRGAANWFLIAAGFIFYAWGEQEYIWVLLLSLLVNYLGARLMGKAGESRSRSWGLGSGWGRQGLSCKIAGRAWGGP